LDWRLPGRPALSLVAFMDSSPHANTP